MMNLKTKGIIALFVLLTIILAVNPKAVNDLYATVLGRVFLIGIVVFLSTNHVILGLLVALAVIAGLNQFGSFVEGMENQVPTTIGDDNVSKKGDKKVVVTTKRLSELKSDADGVDKEDIKVAIMAKDSKQIPVDPGMTSSTEVNAFTTGMLDTSAKLEGFSAYASVIP